MEILLIVLLAHFIGGWLFGLLEIWLACSQEIEPLPSWRNLALQSLLWELAVIGVIAVLIRAQILKWLVGYFRQKGKGQKPVRLGQ